MPSNAVRKQPELSTAKWVYKFGADTTEGRAEMRNLAEKFNRRFRIAVFQFAVRWAHAAQRLNLAGVANGWPRFFLCADFVDRAFPAFAKTSFSDVVALLMGNHADAHGSGGIHSAAV